MDAKPVVRRCALPAESRLREHLAHIDYCDSYRVTLPPTDATILEVYAAILGRPPTLFRHLLVLRSLIVSPLGIGGVGYADLGERIDTSTGFAVGDRIGRWTLFGKAPEELITGSNDKHLDFRVSVLRERTSGAESIVVSTGVQTHNAFGRVYLAAIQPFHALGVRHLLARGI